MDTLSLDSTSTSLLLLVTYLSMKYSLFATMMSTWSRGTLKYSRTTVNYPSDIKFKMGVTMANTTTITTNEIIIVSFMNVTLFCVLSTKSYPY